MKNKISRKQFLIGAGATISALAAPAIASAARHYTIKLGIDLETNHPVTAHLQMVANEITATTNGEVRLQIFPNNQLGNDTHMLSEVRTGALEMMAIGDGILALLVPSCSIDNVGFAFKKAQTAWDALDGSVGDIVRNDITKAGLHPMHKIWDMGFRQVTSGVRPIENPASLKGFKIRVPPSPMNVSLFKDLGAAPTTLNAAALYSALQTKVVDGQETPLGFIESDKLYQVQKYCSITNHIWLGYWMVANDTFWQNLPKDHQKAVENAFDKVVGLERIANENNNHSIRNKLQSQGLIFNEPQQDLFVQALIKAGYYKSWKDQFGTALWSALETYTGKIG